MADRIKSLLTALHRMQRNTDTLDEDVANAMRRFSQRLGWPAAYTRSGENVTALRALRGELFARTVDDERTLLTVMLLDLLCTPIPTERITWREALLDVFPYTAGRGAAFQSARIELARRWGRAVLSERLGAAPSPAALDAFLRDDLELVMRNRVANFVRTIAADADPPTPPIRLPIRDGVEAARISRMAWREGWHFDDHVTTESRTLRHKSWAALGERGVVRWARDGYLKTAWIDVQGAGRAQVADRIRAQIAVYTDAELRAQAAQAESPEPARRIAALGFLALDAPVESEPGLVEIFASATRAEAMEVRRAACIGVLYTSWRELEPAVAAVAASDPDDELRTIAANVLESCAKYGWKRVPLA